MAKSVMDYIFRWLASKFLSPEAQKIAGVIRPAESHRQHPAQAAGAKGTDERSADGNGKAGQGRARDLAPVTFLLQQDAPSCHDCGAIMVRNGSCYKCMNCGSTSGCS